MIYDMLNFRAVLYPDIVAYHIFWECPVQNPIIHIGFMRFIITPYFTNVKTFLDKFEFS